jgi:O-antigen/teichoic acid export membrane protein
MFWYSLPLLSSQFGFLFRGALVVLLLEVLRGSAEVAEFRAVLPFARLNVVVLESFTFLFTPIAARMFVRNDSAQLNDLYWKSAVWVALLTFPIILATCLFAQPFTVLMLGERYRDSALVLAVLASGFFFDAALGFTVQTLRVFANVRLIVLCDVAAILAALGLNVLLIPRYGAAGASVATAAAMIGQNLLYLACLRCSTAVGVMGWRHAQVYLSMGLTGAFLLGVQLLVAPPPYVTVTGATAS